MQIVIDIPKKLYKMQFCTDWDDYTDKYRLHDAIVKGVVIPRGHGRIGDLSEIYIKLNDAQIEGTEEYKGLVKAKQIVCDAPTILRQ